MPISQTVYRKCAMCGKTYPVRVGDVIKTEDLMPYICRKCAGKKSGFFDRWRIWTD